MRCKASGRLPVGSSVPLHHVTETYRMQSVLFGMQNRAFSPHLVAVHGLLTPVMSIHPRGAGDILGKKQSGRDCLNCLKAAVLPRDTRLLDMARARAVRVINQFGLDPGCWPPALLAALKRSSPPELDVVPTRALATTMDAVAV
jgi:hypothetical protein